MSDLSEIVDSLENRISKLLHRHEILKQSNVALTEELQLLKSRHDEYENEIQQWQEKCTSLKLANSILGSDQHKRETKLKINALVREIDLCIAQLSE
ncbi:MULTISPECIES: hypothetical protein [Altibacter]|uniref:hypothetical protein n=1 Tax=Altibacter TaxID=1535231 RepID=UPI00054DEFF9|nr:MULTISPECIES: hypothetical protein [Altibacter]MCW8980287.1 hypothetical protein [Altibacter sp.]MCW9036384.1 hypothetical protein [Altibacter sp.]